ncbi:unnamed protein product [Zymoseptoria tritici ST99CH_1A5]|uniref:CRAL-TRIO domain-containing protein n=4 Tax=Zymoseptoria tritici TaxID=1047171 RepID=A0A1X7S6W4_ZYMT9|nr:unnamed protein product [Zymoseptoria tritici ST99CH_3D7]SMR60623.1 unnamed protein product [Zymoseptoria tritici ST99CH_1E4]SMR63735.1 unnamed protein product [Zymoseptoria tritici ST99CH_3D1]SMY29095.1 unnamed protein product [Zymoseptoria tritici ST99CH_1A5]
MSVVIGPLRCRRILPPSSLRVSHRVGPIGQPNFLQQSFRRHQTAFPAPPRPAARFEPQRSGLDSTTFLIAATFSLGAAYIGLQYTTADTPVYTAAEEPKATVALSAQEFNLVMAQEMPPGRPGNLTPEQETKLKEMWAALLDLCGVSHEQNGTAAAVSSPTPAPRETPDKKTKKSRLSLFGKKDKEIADSEPASGVDNDKHGQTKEFQQALASLSPEALRDALWSMSKHDHPDALLLRFLRARKWDVQAALVMLIATMHWRSQEMHLDDEIMMQGEGHAVRQANSSDPAEKKEGEDFLVQMRLGKSFLHGVDKEGRPCCYVRARLHHGGEQSEKSLERLTVYTIETARMLLRPPVDTATIVFDLTDFSMANMDYTPVKFMIKCFEANYPESLGSVIVYKSPWLFQGIWKIIKGWLDPVVAGKVHFASNPNDLEQWIPREHMMKELGGDEDYVYQYVEPKEGEDVEMAKTAEKEPILAERKELVDSFESETISWMHGNDAGEGRLRLAQRLAENYWKLDPYVRAKSVYDRTGVLGPKGELNFYPEEKKPVSASAGGAHDELD